MRKIAAAAVLLGLLSFTASAQARTSAIEISMVETSYGPQVYQAGHVSGWNLDADVFVNQDDNSVVIGPIRRGEPPHPDVVVRFVASGQKLRPVVWVRSDQPWLPEAVVFTRGDEQIGAGVEPVVIEPWSKAIPITRIFSIR